MSPDLGPRTFGRKEDMVFLGRDFNERPDYSEETARQIDNAVNKFITQAHKDAQTLIRAHKDKIEQVVVVLIDKETLERDAFEAIMKA
jgi:cell division protease FtsH